MLGQSLLKVTNGVVLTQSDEVVQKMKEESCKPGQFLCKLGRTKFR